MEITSKGLRSEFIFHGFGAVSTDHGDCISVRTPNNTDYFFGNFLLFPEPPRVGDFGRWMDRFTEVFAPYSGIRHHTFQWLPSSAPDAAALEEFTRAGFTIDETSVLATQSVHTDKPAPDGVDFRQIRTDAEWLAVIDAQTRDGYPQIPMDEYRRYKEAAFANYRRMSEEGLGDWWGAFKGEELVADLGLFFGDGVGRFQSVETAPEHRRQGICRAMVDHVSNYGLAAHPGITLVMWADAHDVARGIYCSVGFKEIETLHAVVRAPVQD
jgi:ribosomal protein S18 acetylase RimI-like enzyme